MRHNRSVWDKLAWFVILFIVIWLFLKVIGVINTPLWLEYSPVFGAVYLAGWAVSKSDRATEDIKNIKEDINNIKKKCSVCNIDNSADYNT